MGVRDIHYKFADFAVYPSRLCLFFCLNYDCKHQQFRCRQLLRKRHLSTPKGTGSACQRRGNHTRRGNYSKKGAGLHPADTERRGLQRGENVYRGEKKVRRAIQGLLPAPQPQRTMHLPDQGVRMVC